MIILDLLLLRAEELRSLQNHYPDMKVRFAATSSMSAVDRYVVEVLTEDEEGYYNFLLDNFMIMASRNFMVRLEADSGFRERMRQRIAE